MPQHQISSWPKRVLRTPIPIDTSIESVIVSISYEATRLPPSRGHERSRTISTPYDIQHPF